MPLRKGKLLIVDDEPETRSLLSQIFTARGHDVSCAEDGFAALHQMRRSKPDIILSDLNMPGMSGFELLSVVRRRLPDIYVIATSGAYSGDTVPDGIAADAFYEKATGLPGLFNIVASAAEATSDFRSIDTRGKASSSPIWIAVESAHADNGCLAIACPECLRIFTHTLALTSGVVHRKSCVFCRSDIHFAIVSVLPPVSELAYQTSLDKAGIREREAGPGNISFPAH